MSVQQCPEPVQLPWADGDSPYGKSVDLNEYPHAVLGLKVCRSFRADLRHKLEILLRAHGGYGRGGVRRASWALKISPRTFREWLNWRAFPSSLALLENLDERYVESLEILARQKCQTRKRRRSTPSEHRETSSDVMGQP